MRMTVLGLDVGTKTVGVAVSDELGMTAQPLTTVRRVNLRQDVGALRALAEERGAKTLVLGLPLNMDGSEGERASAVRAFGSLLAKELDVRVEYWDERLSTVAANRMLLDADLSRAKRRKVVDHVAAALILQGWMDARGPGGLDERED